MEPAYRLHYRELYENHWWWRARERVILSTIEHIRSNRNWGPILDVGCGDGLFFDTLSKFGDVDGIEPNLNLVKPENRWKNRISICSFDDFQPHKQYSLILTLDVLEHLSDPLGCLVRASELLTPSGIVIITVPAFQCLWTGHDDLNHHLTRYTRSSLIHLAAEAGMTVYSCRYFFHWTFLAKCLIHLKEQFVQTSPQIPRIPPRWLNETAYALSCLEQKIFGVFPLPFGSSLILVAGKQ